MKWSLLWSRLFWVLIGIVLSIGVLLTDSHFLGLSNELLISLVIELLIIFIPEHKDKSE